MSAEISFLQAARALNKPGHRAKPLVRLKFFARACLRPRSTRAWLSQFAQPDLAPAYEAHPRLALKLQRLFITTRWDAAARFAVLTAHYRIMREFLSPEALRKIYTGGFYLAGIVNTTTNRRLALQLAYTSQFEREGELTLSLVDSVSGVPLSSISFCLCEGADGAGARRLCIGGLQACGDSRVRPIIHDIAKEMHGLRAKALVLWCLQQLAAHWGATEIHAVDDAHHVSNDHNRREKIAASYDEFWAESEGGHDAAAGFWRIPLQPRQRSREELKPSRRRQHERRYEFLADLRVSLLGAARNCEYAEFFYASAEKTAPAIAPLVAPAACVAGDAAYARELAVTVAGLE